MSGIRAALVAAVLVLGGCRSLPSGLVPIDSKLAEYVPSDAVMLAGVRLSDVRATATYKRFETSKGFPQFDEFKRHTGLDPRTDLSEILAASDGNNWIVACRGKFDPPAIEQRALKEGAQRMPHGKYTLIGRQEGAVVFVDSSTALAGAPAVLKTALDRRSGIPSTLVEKLKAVPRESQLWFITTGAIPVPQMDPGSAMGPINQQNFARLFGNLQGITAFGDLRTGVNLKASGVSATENDAKQIYDAIRGFIGLGRLTTRSDQTATLQLYDSIAVTINDRTVTIRADLPLDLIEKLTAIPRQGD